MGPTSGFSDVMTVALGLLLTGVAVHSIAGFLVSRGGMGALTVEHGILSALLAALAWAVLTHVPLVGGILTAVAWVAVRVRYPGGWLRATGHGLAAWATATVLIDAVSPLDVGGVRAVGSPETWPADGPRERQLGTPFPRGRGSLRRSPRLADPDTAS